MHGAIAEKARMRGYSQVNTFLIPSPQPSPEGRGGLRGKYSPGFYLFMTNDIHAHRILILDFGSQYTQLIARRVREQGVYCEIWPYDTDPAEIEQFGARGFILPPADGYRGPHQRGGLRLAGRVDESR